MPRCDLDHLVVGAASLEDGVAYIERKLGAAVPEGGKHPHMGTHNRLMQVGGGTYLEIIAVDPEAPPPGRPRWFGLDDPTIRRRLSQSPALLTWVVRTDDIAAAVAAAPVSPGEITDGRRGDVTWQVTITPDGTMPEGGLFPALIQWPDGKGPASNMADLGCRLKLLTVRHPEPDRLRTALAAIGTVRHPEPDRLRTALAAIGAEGLVEVEQGDNENPAGLTALIGSPKGLVEIS